MQVVELARKIEQSIFADDGRAAKAHLAAGRPVYYGDPKYPGQIVREFPDGHREIVTIDLQNVVTVIKSL